MSEDGNLSGPASRPCEQELSPRGFPAQAGFQILLVHPGGQGLFQTHTILDVPLWAATERKPRRE